MKPITIIQGIEIPQNMRNALENLTYQEQFTHFTLTKNYRICDGTIPKGEVMLDCTKILSEEDEDVVAIVVCDGIVVGVEVELREYSHFSKGVELFNQNHHQMHSIFFRYGGHHYDFAEIYAKYSFAFNGN